MSRDRTGQCMCGAVTLSARQVPDAYGACHCDMCRRWTGAALLAVEVPCKNTTFHGSAHIRKLQSSAWAERAWCAECGSSLWYRVTEPGPMNENYEIPIGLFDDTTGMQLVSEIYHDVRASGCDFSAETTKLSRADTLKEFQNAQIEEDSIK